MNFIFEYYQAIKTGTVAAGEWLRLFYEMIVNGLDEGRFFFEPKLATRAIKFIENFCRHHEGALAPNLIKLELWQKALVSVIFGIVDETGARQFREILLIIGRKNGKTLLAAAVSAYCAFLDGEYGARIYFAAPKLEQASLCFDAFAQMLWKEPELAAMAKKRRSDIYIEQTNTTAKPLAFNAKKSDGLNISLAVLDEVSSWQGEQGLKYYEVLKSSQGARRQPLMLSITTAGYINDGIYDELFKRATAVLKGTSKESRFAPVIYAIDDVDKWNDIGELAKANPNLGVSVSVDYLLEEIAIAEGSFSKKVEFLCKYCNVKQNSSTAWLSTQTVKRCFSETHISPENWQKNYCVIGVDLSQTVDLTAAVAIIEKHGRLNVLAHFWMPASRIDTATEEDGVPYRAYVDRGELSLSGDNFVDYKDVERWIGELTQKYKILPLKIGYDRYSSNYLVQDLNASGYQTDDVFQGTNLTGTINVTEGLLKDGAFDFGDNNLMKIHLLNAAMKNETGGRRKLVKIGTRTRIDGVAALLDAMCMRQKYAELAVQLRNAR